MKSEFMDLANYIPTTVISPNNQSMFSLTINSHEDRIFLSYKGKNSKEYSEIIPRYIPKTPQAFLVIGLLQAEMGKTNNGTLSYANHEYHLINPVLKWFEKILDLPKNMWKWSIKLNINEPEDQTYKNQVEGKVIKHWLRRTPITLEHAFPKKVTYIKNTPNKKLKFYDYGTLVLEYRNSLFSQIIKHFIKKITYEEILNFDDDLIRNYMKGVIAGDGCVAHHEASRHYAVHISATDQTEREVYKTCLAKLGIQIKYYNNYKEMLISKKYNLIQLLKQRIMTVSREKYAKFTYMMQHYPDIKELTGYFQPKGKNIWSRLPQEKIQKIVSLYNEGITRTITIAQKLNISTITVNRVLRKHGLGKRVISTPEKVRKEIARFTLEHPKLTARQIAKHFKVHEAVVRRAYKKYGTR